ncbi:Ubiquitin carboxyl-terminal hydrolase YUH1 [Candida viswanathii]|uniref:Ubiquitin carboxyl-terminal hydrolase n=1 Tax=Candida viswanathii TaxID=5486 RepID=A0A367XTJ2_9ASCO|nr:Ubiquitin carboxyl-terminal hydrolase YUH1 [Candida viswanathii]
MTKNDSKSVIPLESNPAIFTDLAYNLGLTPVLEFHDVYSLTDQDLLGFLPSPIYAVILLFPLSNNYENYRKEQDTCNGKYNNELNSQVKWFKQTIGNGCGLYALLHILTNLPKDLIVSNSKLANLLENIGSGMSVDETSSIIEALESDIKLDENFGERGQTEAPAASESVDLHFITFIKGKDNHLYELDGRRNGPIDLGESVDESNIIKDPLLTEKIQFYIDNADEANRNNFAIMAIGPSTD